MIFCDPFGNELKFILTHEFLAVDPIYNLLQFLIIIETHGLQLIWRMMRVALLITSLSTLATISFFCLHILKAMEVSPILEVGSLGLPKDPSSSYPSKLETKYAHIVPTGRVVKKVDFISVVNILDLEPRLCSVVPK